MKLRRHYFHQLLQSSFSKHLHWRCFIRIFIAIPFLQFLRFYLRQTLQKPTSNFVLSRIIFYPCKQSQIQSNQRNCCYSCQPFSWFCSYLPHWYLFPRLIEIPISILHERVGHRYLCLILKKVQEDLVFHLKKLKKTLNKPMLLVQVCLYFGNF